MAPPRRAAPLRLGPALALALAAPGCRSAPTADEAHAQLRGGDPVSALATARRAAAQGTPAERLAARRVAVRAALSAGLAAEAASDYEHLRRDLGRDDEALLAEVAAGALRAAGASPDPARRLGAVAALTPEAEDPRAPALLRAPLGDARGVVRAAAARALARTRDRDAPAALAELAARDPDPEVRRQALASLEVAAGDPAAVGTDAGALRAAAGRLADPDAGVRREALGALGRAAAGDGPAAAWARARLTEALGRGEDAERLAAAEGLLLADPAAARAAWADAARRGHVPSAGAGAPGSAGEAFAAGLLVHGGGPLAPARAALDRAAPYPVRLAAARALRGPGAARLDADLARAAREDPAAPVRGAAFLARLAGASDEAAARALCVAALDDPDPALRRRAAARLEARAGLDTPALVALLERGDPAVADEVARGLLLRGGEAGWHALREAVARGDLAALAALGRAGDPDLRPQLLELLAGPPGLARVEAVRALARAGALEDRPALVGLLARGPAADGADLAAAVALLALDRRAVAPAPASEQ